MILIWGRVGSMAVIVLLAAGCSSIGPETIPRDRFHYVEAIRAAGALLLDAILGDELQLWKMICEKLSEHCHSPDAVDFE